MIDVTGPYLLVLVLSAGSGDGLKSGVTVQELPTMGDCEIVAKQLKYVASFTAYCIAARAISPQEK